MSQSYNKPCRDCKQQITMMEMNGRWGAYNLDGSGYHQCLGLSKKHESAAEVKQKPQAVEERLARLEKAVFRDSEGK